MSDNKPVRSKREARLLKIRDNWLKSSHDYKSAGTSALISKEPTKTVEDMKVNVTLPQKLSEDSSYKNRKFPKDPKLGVENEWGAVAIYKDEFDRMEQEKERLAERQKKQIYKEELDEQNRYIVLRKNLDNQIKRRHDISFIKEKQEKAEKERLRELLETDNLKKAYGGIINSTLNEKLIYLERQKRDAMLEKAKLKQEIDRTIREAEEFEREQKMQLKNELAHFYSQQNEVIFIVKSMDRYVRKGTGCELKKRRRKGRYFLTHIIKR